MVLGVGFEPTYGKPGQIYSLLLLTAQPPQHYQLMKRNRKKNPGSLYKGNAHPTGEGSLANLTP